MRSTIVLGKLYLCCIITLFVYKLSVTSLSLNDSSVCSLNFTSFLYKPSGECINDPKSSNEWQKSLCCSNYLAVISHALALQARTTRTQNIFLNEDQWRNCTGSNYLHEQKASSLQTCRYDNLFYGSSHCSSFPLPVVQGRDLYKSAVSMCSGWSFDSSFDEACNKCTSAVLSARDDVMDYYEVKGNRTEEAICGVAVVTSIVAGELDDPSSIENFCRCLPAFDKLRKESGYIKLKYVTASIILGLLLSIIGFLLSMKLLPRLLNKKKHIQSTPYGDIVACPGLYRFSKSEIENAMNFGNEKESLGRGSAGEVFKGVLPSGQLVAIKRIYKKDSGECFVREVEGLSRVRHPNLVCLFGCCGEGEDKYLVYEYCHGGNLAQHLLKKDVILTWKTRVKILRDCALGLRYLHHYIDGCIVHRDIKLTNILLTHTMEAKLSDFGLAKMLGSKESKVLTQVRGTMGYMDPEYITNAKLTCASDIYSFGVVMLQLLSGQKVFQLDLNAREQLTRKARDVSLGMRPSSDFEDPSLNGKLNKVDFESILQLAVLCVAKSGKNRPDIDVVYDEMERIWQKVDEDRIEKPVQSPPMTSPATSISTSLEIGGHSIVMD